MANDRTPSRIASLLGLLGGAVIIAGCLLTWVDAGEGVSVGNVSVTGLARGSDLRLGQAALGAGVASVVLGVSLLIFRRARKVVGLLVLLAGLVAIATAAYVYRSPEDRYADFAADTGAPAGETDEVRASLSNLFEVSNLEANPGVGLYVVIGGGAVSVVAGLAGLFGRRRHAEPRITQRRGDRRGRPRSRPGRMKSPTERLPRMSRQVCGSVRSMTTNEPSTVSRISLLRLPATPVRRRTTPPERRRNRRPRSAKTPWGTAGPVSRLLGLLRLELGDQLVHAPRELFAPPGLAFVGQGRDRVVVVVPP
jgi:hypothetical protein